MATASEWLEIKYEILSRLDVVSLYREAGVEITGSRASSSGWLQCRAYGRPDNSPSAAINVGNPPLRGRYRDLGGQGLSLSLFDFLVHTGQFPDFKTARRELAKRAGVSLPHGFEPKAPADSLDFLPLDLSILKTWCKIKGGFSLDAVLQAGAQLARYPRAAKRYEWQQTVVAFPGYGHHLTEDDPVAWFIARVDGEPIRKFEGKGKPPSLVKVLSCGGSEASLLNRFALQHIEQAEVVWKVEGLTDMLATQSWIPPELQGKHVVITNGFGSQERVQPWMLRLLTGKVVPVVGDRDHSGETGAAYWVSQLVGKAKEVYNIQLPFPFQQDHGLDVRDLLQDYQKEDPLLTDALHPPLRPQTMHTVPTAATPAHQEELADVPLVVNVGETP